jgi:hypothetical protein
LIVDGVVVIALSRDKLMDAYHGCTQMADLVPEMLCKLNCDGLGEEDYRECRQALLTAASACLMLINTMDADAPERAGEDLNG